MEWKKLPNGDRQAVGKHGDFLIWKSGGVFKARYRSTDKKVLYFLPVKRSLKEAKAQAEDNGNWEHERKV